LIIDAHRHVIVPEITARAVPEAWRPAIRPADGRSVVSFRGREINSVLGEFSDVDAILAGAAATGVDHLLLSPWINLVPVDAAARDAQLVCQVQNEALARLVAAEPRLSAVGAVPLQDPERAARELPGLAAAGLAGVEIPSSVAAGTWVTTSSCRSGQPRPAPARWSSSTRPPAASASRRWTATTCGTRWATRWKPR
jgi:predicted TIM-barrel fold metal-dependent hydrolase